MPPLATIVITTKNRKDDLALALQSCVAQEGFADGRIEVLVIDDGSDDGTSEMVRTRFPGVRLHREEKSQGLIVERNRGARLAEAPIVVSLDDDCTLPSPRIILDTLADFDHPRVGAVAMPFREPKGSGAMLSGAPEKTGVWCTWTYNGCSHAVRKDLFLALGGYFEPLYQYKEEVDYCARLLDRGYVVRMGRADITEHHVTPTARPKARHRYHESRSTMMFAWRNTPMPYLPLHLAAATLREAKVYRRKGHLWATIKGTVMGHFDGLRYLGSRGPISVKAYKAILAMKKSGHPKAWPGLPLEKVEELIGPMPG